LVVYAVIGPIIAMKWVPIPEFLDEYARIVSRHTTAESRIVLTEAGRLAYYSPAQVSDIVGLNDATFARRPFTRADLTALSPDLVFVAAANAFDFHPVPQQGCRLCPLSHGDLLASATNKFREAMAGGDRYVRAVPLIEQAAAHAGDALAHSSDYDTYFRSYEATYLIVAVKKTSPAAALALAEMQTVGNDRRLSYWEMKAARGPGSKGARAD